MTDYCTLAVPFLGFPEAIEDLAVQLFVPGLAIEGLAVAILPR